jgi:hypothetical protein
VGKAVSLSTLSLDRPSLLLLFLAVAGRVEGSNSANWFGWLGAGTNSLLDGPRHCFLALFSFSPGSDSVAESGGMLGFLGLRLGLSELLESQYRRFKGSDLHFQ